MSKRLFVGGLPYSVTNTELEEMFSQVGKVVSVNVITDRDTGQSKGFGFVEMEEDEKADEAINKLNGTTLGERTIAVSVAKPREERPRFDNRRGGPRRDDRRPRRGGYR